MTSTTAYSIFLRRRKYTPMQWTSSTTTSYQLFPRYSQLKLKISNDVILPCTRAQSHTQARLTSSKHPLQALLLSMRIHHSAPPVAAESDWHQVEKHLTSVLGHAAKRESFPYVLGPLYQSLTEQFLDQSSSSITTISVVNLIWMDLYQLS